MNIKEKIIASAETVAAARQRLADAERELAELLDEALSGKKTRGGGAAVKRDSRSLEDEGVGSSGVVLFNQPVKKKPGPKPKKEPVSHKSAMAEAQPAPGKAIDRVRDILKEGPRGAADLQNVTGFSMATIYGVLNRLHEKDEAKRTEEGNLWELVA